MLTLLRSALLVSAISVAANAGHSHEARQVANRTSSSPNFVFIITDDQRVYNAYFRDSRVDVNCLPEMRERRHRRLCHC